jgi:uncharacterized membrane protein
MHYLPLSLPFFSILVGLFLLLVALIQVGILRYAYMRLGVSSGAALLLLLGSLLGSYINIPLVNSRNRTSCPDRRSSSLACTIPCPSWSIGPAR